MLLSYPKKSKMSDVIDIIGALIWKHSLLDFWQWTASTRFWSFVFVLGADLSEVGKDGCWLMTILQFIFC